MLGEITPLSSGDHHEFKSYVYILGASGKPDSKAARGHASRMRLVPTT